MRFTKSTEAWTFAISVWARKSGEAPAANVRRRCRPRAGALAVEGRPQLGHERGEVLLVLRPVRVAVAGQARVLPVHVEAVEVVAAHEVDGARHEDAAALRR